MKKNKNKQKNPQNTKKTHPKTNKQNTPNKNIYTSNHEILVQFVNNYV